MSREEFLGVVEWAAHHRFNDVVKALTFQMVEAGMAPPSGGDINERIFIAGLEDAVTLSGDTESYEAVLETLEVNKDWIRRCLSEREYFDLRLKILRQMIVDVLRNQLPSDAHVAPEDVAKLDMDPYWILLDKYFPRDQRARGRLASPAPDSEEAEYWSFCMDKERKALLDVMASESQKESRADAKKVSYLLQHALKDAFHAEIKAVSRKMEGRLLGPPKQLLFVPREQEALLLGSGGIEGNRSILAPKRDWRHACLYTSHKSMEHLSSVETASETRGAARRHIEDGEAHRVGEETEKKRGGKGKSGGDTTAKGHEISKLEKTTTRLLKTIERQGGDPLPSNAARKSPQKGTTDVLNKSVEAATEPGHVNKRGENSKAGAAARAATQGGLIDYSAPGRQISFNDSQFPDEVEEAAEGVSSKMSKKRKGSSAAARSPAVSGSKSKRRGGPTLDPATQPPEEQEEEEEEDREEAEDQHGVRASARKTAKGRGRNKKAAVEEVESEEIEEDETEEERPEGNRLIIDAPGRPHRFSLPENRWKGKERRRGRVRWSEREVAILKQAVGKDKMVGRWADILDRYAFHPKRTSVDIKDKYRNLVKGGEIQG